jgi:putative peptidoglycan lipid II flippase
VLGWIFARPLTELVVKPEFVAIPGQLDRTVWLTRMNLPFLTLIAVAAACMGIQNALRRFFVPASAPAMYNVFFILSTVIGYGVFSRMGLEPIMALSVGMLGGGLTQLLVQIPGIRREGYRHEWRLNFRDPALREVMFLMGPGTIGAAAAQINLLVNTWLATGELGAPSALRYAFTLMYLPIGIFGVSVATAAIPELARQAAEGAHQAMIATVSWGIRLMLVLSVPAIVGLMVLAYPIVELIYQRGQFNSVSTMMTAPALLCYAPGILGYSIVKIVSPTFYSLSEPRTPVIVSIVTIGVNLVLNLWLNSIYGFRGLALGTAISAIVNAGLLLALLSHRLGGGDFPRILRTFVKSCIASAAMGIAAHYSHVWLRSMLPQPHDLQRAVCVAGSIGIALAVLAASAHLLRMEEFGAAMSRIIGRIRRPPATP